ncbi:hypothetical protein BJX65DRAFT_283821 [Aspergillus insuetus]
MYVACATPAIISHPALSTLVARCVDMQRHIRESIRPNTAPCHFHRLFRSGNPRIIQSTASFFSAFLKAHVSPYPRCIGSYSRTI